MINLKRVDPLQLSKDVVEPTLAVMKVLDVRANVALVLDDSGSMEHEYEEGHVQDFSDRALALANVWDVDKKVDVFALNKGPFVGTMDTSSYHGWVQRNVCAAGGTAYATVIRAIVARFGTPTSHLAVGRAAAPGGLLDRVKNFFGFSPPPAPLSAEPAAVQKVTDSPLPTLVLFLTDGECTDQSQATHAIQGSYNAPVYFLFIGLGEQRFEYPQELARVNTNVGFFKLPCEDDNVVVEDNWLYQQIAKPFGAWLKQARTAGIVA